MPEGNGKRQSLRSGGISRPGGRNTTQKSPRAIRRHSYTSTFAPNGAIVKVGAVDKSVGGYHKGPAICFDSQDDALHGIANGKVKEGHVVVIRYEGPKGGPGMPEMLAPTSQIMGMGLGAKVGLITDGRFSDASRGISIGHISPEAAEGGPIAFVHDGDIIELDLGASIDNEEVYPILYFSRLLQTTALRLTDQRKTTVFGHMPKTVVSNQRLQL